MGAWSAGSRVSRIRNAATAIANAAVLLAGPEHVEWAEASRRELDAIPGDRAALGWAVGAFRTALAERTATMPGLRTATRVTLVLVIGVYAAATVLPWLMIVAYRSGWTPVLRLLGGATAGDDWRTFLPLLTGTPSWLVAAMAGASILFVAGIALVAMRSRVGLHVLATAVILTAVQLATFDADPNYIAIFSMAGLVQDWIMLAVIACLVAAGFVVLARGPGAARPAA